MSQSNQRSQSYDILDLEQGSPQWLEARRTKIGASDAPVIMGVSPWKTPYQLWEAKMKGDATPTNAAMQRGHQMEPIIRMNYESATGKEFLPIVLQSIPHPWMLASLDGISEDMHHAIEIKCAGQSDHECAKNGLVPDHYYPQLQHQMAVCGLDSITYISCKYDDIDDVSVINVRRDEKYIQEMIVKEKEFHNCMINNIAPEFAENDYIEHNDPEFLLCANEWRRIKGLMAIYEVQEKSMRQVLIKKAEGHNCKGAGIRMSKLTRKGNVKYDSIPELKTIDLEAYRGSPTEYWKIEEA